MQYFFISIESFDSTQQLLIAFDADGRQYGIPDDPNNTDYATYLAWVAEGNTAEEWTEI